MNATHPAVQFRGDRLGSSSIPLAAEETLRCAQGDGYGRQLASRPCRAARNPIRSRRSAFTLVELLVVIGIILVLMALLLPAVNKAWNTGVRTKMAFDLQTISTALEAYRADFQQYPQVFGTSTPSPFTNAVWSPSSASNQGQGAYWLCRALVGPGNFATDGAGPGNPANTNESPFGFRAVTGGKIWGPYIAPDTIKMGDPTGNGNMNNYVLMDRYKHPILYYPAKKGTNITHAGGYLGPNGMFNPYDNTGIDSSDSTTGVMSPQMFMVLMGDVNQNGAIDPGETPAYTGNYVLWSPGLDEIFGETNGLATPAALPSPSNPCDDVANFPR